MIGQVKGILPDSAPPIGFVWKSSDPTSPAAFFDRTVWKPVKDCAILASGTLQNGATGGEAEHTVTLAQMPSHEHTGTTNSTGAHKHKIKVRVLYDYSSDRDNILPSTWRFNNTKQSLSIAGDHTHVATIGSTGGGQPFSLLNPYIVRYMWERIG